MAATYALKLVTPERTVYAGQVTELLLRASEGDMGVLAHHIPLITAVKPSVVRVLDEGGTWRRYAVGGGFLEVGRQVTVLLADTAEGPDEVHRDRAAAARDRALERLERAGSDMDRVRARQALERAEARLAVLDDNAPA
ncbi:MAG: ATP synthase F1 subunit epsilon [Thermaerobacter sp.]|nr:ATP synthase F1 subunit epsilon [Thermaerobacter sp.]